MGRLGPEERRAIEAVAKHFAATLREGDDPPGAYLMLGGRRIAIDIGVLAPPGTGRRAPVKPRLRYDRVALRFVRDLRDRLRPALANGETAILTVRAPILQAGKTVAALEERFRSRRAGGPKTTALQVRFFGNRIGVRVVPNAAHGSEIIVFVHSAGSSPGIVANAAQSLLESLRTRAGNTATEADGARWLILRGASALGDTCRDACTQLSDAAPFEKIVLVGEGGRVETVAG